jgi:ABC-2 type transport system ATP-binding protein
MLSIKNMTIQTRHPILTDFSYDFHRGNLYGIVATNGSGKTTFFRSIAGLLPVISGQVFWETADATVKRDFFYYETSEWFEGHLTGWDYLDFIKKEWQSSIDIQDIIDFWGMGDYIKLPIRTYSLGMKQRLLIAMYQVSDAKCLLMDEMTNGLDETSRRLFFTMLNRIKEDKLIILTSHYQEDIEEHCDYILQLKNQGMEVNAL